MEPFADAPDGRPLAAQFILDRFPRRAGLTGMVAVPVVPHAGEERVERLGRGTVFLAMTVRRVSPHGGGDGERVRIFEAFHELGFLFGFENLEILGNPRCFQFWQQIIPEMVVWWVLNIFAMSF